MFGSRRKWQRDRYADVRELDLSINAGFVVRYTNWFFNAFDEAESDDERLFFLRALHIGLQHESIRIRAGDSMTVRYIWSVEFICVLFRMSWDTSKVFWSPRKRRQF